MRIYYPLPYDIPSTAGILNVSTRTIRRWIKEGKLETFTDGYTTRVKKSSAMRLKEERESKGKL